MEPDPISGSELLQGPEPEIGPLATFNALVIFVGKFGLFGERLLGHACLLS